MGTSNERGTSVQPRQRINGFPINMDFKMRMTTFRSSCITRYGNNIPFRNRHTRFNIKFSIMSIITFDIMTVIDDDKIPEISTWSSKIYNTISGGINIATIFTSDIKTLMFFLAFMHWAISLSKGRIDFCAIYRPIKRMVRCHRDRR